VIKNVVLHFANEQPLMADLIDLPGSTDAGMLCTNLRGLDGKRPVFIDQTEATFYFPFHVIRFLEMAPGALDRHHASGGSRAGASRADASWDDRGEDGASPVPEVIALSDGMPSVEEEPELELDEDFLRRIRDI
jgi:hypothetical protein